MTQALILFLYDQFLFKQLRQLVLNYTLLGFHLIVSLLDFISHLAVMLFAKLEFIFEFHQITRAGLDSRNLPFLSRQLSFHHLHLTVLAFHF